MKRQGIELTEAKGFYTDGQGRKRPITDERMLGVGNRRYLVPEKKEEEKVQDVEKDEQRLEQDTEELKEEVKDPKSEDSKGPIDIKNEGSLEGWEHNQSETTRHEHIRQSIKDNGKAETEKKLTALETLDKSRDPAVAKAAHSDISLG